MPIGKLLFSGAQIQNKIVDIASDVDKLITDKCPLFVCVMDGAIHFFSDLTRYLYFPGEYGFVRAKSYQGTESTGVVLIDWIDDLNIKGREIFLIEDIVDTGSTITEIANSCWGNGAKNVNIITLLSKPSRRKVDVKIDVVGWEIPDEFVIGYGMDFNGMYRNLPYISVLKEE